MGYGCLQLVCCQQNLRRALADDDARRHRVTSRHTRHDGTISDPKILYAMDFELVINNRHWTPSHSCGTGLVPDRRDSVPDEVLEFRAFEWSWHDLSLAKRPERRRVTNLAAQLDPFGQSPKVCEIT